ncbi:HEAT repeat domain-containing protein [Candidatus Bathyarchaeota archaeon]|nr:HEAT repeat domain-containing protein [Candidatus Bathyarchaeota archaeon]
MPWNKDNLESLLEQVKTQNYLGRDIYTTPVIFEVKRLYEDLLKSQVDNKLLYQAILILGEADFRQAKSFVGDFLNSPDSELRSIAILSVGLYWRLKEFTNTLKKLVTHDQEEYIRGEAAVALGHIYKASKDTNILEFLLKKLKDDTKEFDNQEEFYSAILRVWGISSRDIYTIKRNLKSENDFDWQRIKEIESFCKH